MTDLKNILDNAPYISKNNVISYPKHYNELCKLAEVCKNNIYITGLWYIEGKVSEDNEMPWLIIRSTVPDAAKERGRVEKELYDCCDCEIMFDYDDIISEYPRGSRFLGNYQEYMDRIAGSILTVYKG